MEQTAAVTQLNGALGLLQDASNYSTLANCSLTRPRYQRSSSLALTVQEALTSVQCLLGSVVRIGFGERVTPHPMLNSHSAAVVSWVR